MQEYRFADKKALITGAASGIGRAIAVQLAREGASVMLADINEAGLSETLGLLDLNGGKGEVITLDVTDRAACFEAVDTTVSAFGNIDVLCNIAGMVHSDHFTDITEQAWQNMLGVNLSSVFYLSQAAMPSLLESRGNIISMASSAGLIGLPYNAMYCATKGAVIALTKALAVEYTGRGVRVNAVCPGGVNTPLIANYRMPDNADMKLLERLYPLMDSNAEPEEIATAVAYLASEDARFISGTVFSIDGGQTA